VGLILNHINVKHWTTGQKTKKTGRKCHKTPPPIFDLWTQQSSAGHQEW